MKKRKIILATIISILLLTGCSEKEEYKFSIKTLDKKELKLTKNNVLEIKNHSSQSYYDKYPQDTIEVIGYVGNAMPYTSRFIFNDRKQELMAHALVIHFKDGKELTFILEENDDISSILKDSNFNITKLEAKNSN